MGGSMNANQPAPGGDTPSQPHEALESSGGGSHKGAMSALAVASVRCSLVGAVSFWAFPHLSTGMSVLSVQVATLAFPVGVLASAASIATGAFVVLRASARRTSKAALVLSFVGLTLGGSTMLVIVFLTFF